MILHGIVNLWQDHKMMYSYVQGQGLEIRL
jgi:hypothetical protein